MQKLDFAEAVDLIIARDSRYDREAYSFLRDALDFTVRQRKKSRHPAGCGHVSGQQLLEGIRQYALKQFGPMVITVFTYWGISRCEDFGEMVYNLIRTGVFGKTETDSIDDFKGGYSFEAAFVTPYQLVVEMSHRLRNLIARAFLRPLKEHVLKNMGEPRPQVLALVN